MSNKLCPHCKANLTPFFEIMDIIHCPICGRMLSYRPKNPNPKHPILIYSYDKQKLEPLVGQYELFRNTKGIKKEKEYKTGKDIYKVTFVMDKATEEEFAMKYNIEPFLIRRGHSNWYMI